MYESKNELLDLEAEEERARQQREIRRKRAQERRAMAEQERRLKRKIFSRLILIFVVMGGALLYTFIFRYPHQKIQDGVIIRDLARGPEFITPHFTEERELAWDSELPKFIKEDFELAEKDGYSIKYLFGTNTLYGKVEDGKWIITVDSPFDTMLSFSFFEEKENFSIYYNSEKEALILYSYPAVNPNQFEQIILYSDSTRWPYSTTLTYDRNLPLSMDIYDSIYSVRYEDYSLYFNRENSTFYFYKDGEVVSSRKFHDTVKDIFSYYGFIETQNQLIYKIYAYKNQKTGLPDLYFVFVESDVMFLQDRFGYSYQTLYGKDINLPIFQNKDGTEFYTVLPEDWDVYQLYGNATSLAEYKPDCNFNINLVPLEESFSYAEFEYSSGWKINLFFAIDGSIFSVKVELDGYDYTLSLTDEEKDALSVRVRSLDALWEHVEKIRDVYRTRYTNSFSELLQK